MIRKLIIILFLTSVIGVIYIFFFWDFPAPEKEIEKELDIQRLKDSE